MTIINANITPLPLYAFRVSAIVQPGTYLLINGAAGKQIRLLNYNISSTLGSLILQDSTGLIITRIEGNGSAGMNGLQELTVGADLQAVITEVTNINCYFVGFLS